MTSIAKQIEDFLAIIVASNELHAKWLNTLSFLENCGARLIAACEHPTLVKEEMLKHAAEEFRHAHYLKKQIQKVSPASLDTYGLSNILGGMATLHYLPWLNAQACRYLKNADFPKGAAYVFVTYAIELRAEELYPIYDAALRKAGSTVMIKSILIEEKEHLHEMKEEIDKLPSGLLHARHICEIESFICQNWLNQLIPFNLL